MQKIVGNPLDDSEGTPRFENSPFEFSKVMEGVNEIMTVCQTFDEKQSCHLTNIIELTQDTKVKYEKLQLLQQTMNRINTNEILEYRQQLQNQMSFSVQSSNQSQPVITSTFKLLIKQKQKQKPQTQQNSEIQTTLTQRNITKIHDCSHEEIVQKPKIPERYKSIQSHYSPKRLELYLNKDHIDYSSNQKWLSYGTHKENKKSRAISNDVKLNQNEISAIEQLKKSLMLQNSRIKNNMNLSNFQSKSPLRNQQKSVTFHKNEEIQEIQQRVDRLSQRLTPKKF